MSWMIDTQMGRRNLTPIQRIAVAERYKEKIRQKAKEKQLISLKQNQDNRLLQTEKTEDKLHTDKELAKIAKVGTGTISRYETVMKSDDEELKQKMLKEEITINAAYQKVKIILLEIPSTP